MIIKRLGFLTCFLISILMLVCSQAPPYSASESTTEDLKPALLQQNQTFKQNHNEVGERGEEKVRIVDAEVVKKTKGTYGGGDLLRPRSKTSGAQPNCLVKPSYIFATLSLLPLFIA